MTGVIISILILIIHIIIILVATSASLRWKAYLHHPTWRRRICIARSILCLELILFSRNGAQGTRNFLPRRGGRGSILEPRADRLDHGVAHHSAGPEVLQAFEASIQEANESPILERASLLAGQFEEMVLSLWQVDARRLHGPPRATTYGMLH